MMNKRIKLNFQFKILVMEYLKIYKKIYLDYIVHMILEIIIDMELV